MVASTESSGAGIDAASRGNDLGESPTVLSRDTIHHMGSEQELCGAASGITSRLTPRFQRRDFLTKPGISTPSSIVPSCRPSLQSMET